MKNIIALGGSNSKNSINKKLAVYAAQQLENVALTIVDLNDFKLPLYGIDLENEFGIHEEAKRLNEIIEQTDGIVLSLAEHNGSYSTAFKNAYDWLSRIDSKVWKNKPMLLMSASPGARGGANVLQTAKAGFPYLGGNIIADFSLPSFYENFKNELINEDLKDELKQKIRDFQAEL